MNHLYLRSIVSVVCLLIKLTGFAQKMNVILIMSDDQGYGEFSFNGNPLIKTPNIDRMALHSVQLTDFHVTPMSTPTRGQLLTGLDAFRNGAINVSSGRSMLRPELKTIADIFNEAGFRTAIFGKWHLGDNYPYRPEDRGFHETLWFPSSHINSVPDYWDNDYFNDILIHNGKRERRDGYCTDVFFDEAIGWMKEQTANKESFFTYISLNSAHWPWFVPEKYRNEIRQSMEENPEVVSHLNKFKRADLVSYLAMGANIDENMGKLNDFLESSGLARNTIVVFLTDNGSTMGADYYNAGMRGNKTTLWEGGHRVPCLIKAPRNVIKKPEKIDQLTHVQDLLPTLCAMVGIKSVPVNLDGINLYPLIKGKVKKLNDRMLVINYSRMPESKVNFTSANPAIPHKNGAAVMWNKWRLLENKALYNIEIDPHQDNDVAGQYPEIVTRMRKHLDQWWDEVGGKALEIQKTHIGNDKENPMLITACEWLDVFVDQQVQIRRGVRKNGIWHIQVDQPGKYEFELRRWPREANCALVDSMDAMEVTDGKFIKGVSLPIHSAEIKVGNLYGKKKIGDRDKCITFSFKLEKGGNSIQTWFYDNKNIEICGAYYVYIKKL